MLGDRWSLLILRDIVLHDRRSFRELLTGSEEGISAPVLSRRLTDLVEAGFLTKSEVARGKQGRYSLTEQGLATVPLLIELGRLGAHIDPSTAHNAPRLGTDPEDLARRIAALRKTHLTDGPMPPTTAVPTEDRSPQGSASQR